ncbi:hypothetical protein EL17_02465 [Anditalea andensis]|uniref:Uncharacterized protein n=1 Tax=Anditalea andensis TaxID=1048983 RepID=A0A074LL41_9BACT|nr:hypothetical protein EL17_02465 [Anditalea andensis]
MMPIRPSIHYRYAFFLSELPIGQGRDVLSMMIEKGRRNLPNYKVTISNYMKGQKNRYLYQISCFILKQL